MRDTRRSVDEQLDRSAAGNEAPPSSASQQHPQGPPGASASGDDGRAGTAPQADAHAEQPAAPDADESALQGDVDELVALAQRTQADFENYRKRVARESIAAQERGAVKLAQELLPALDNLDRALAEAGGEDGLREGVRLVRSELHAALARVGIECFSPQGEAFDPSEHEAMAQQPVEGAKSGTVAEVFQPGYRLGDTIIRPARVLVAA